MNQYLARIAFSIIERGRRSFISIVLLADDLFQSITTLRESLVAIVNTTINLILMMKLFMHITLSLSVAEAIASLFRYLSLSGVWNCLLATLLTNWGIQVNHSLLNILH